MGGFFYGRYTKEQVERANQVDLEELLLRSGEKLLRSGREKRLASDHSVTIRGNEWYDHATGEGGFALSFARKHFGLSFQEAMALLLGKTARRRSPQQNRSRHQNPQNPSHSHPPPEISGVCLATCWGRGRSTARCSLPLYGRALSMRTCPTTTPSL